MSFIVNDELKDLDSYFENVILPSRQRLFAMYREELKKRKDSNEVSSEDIAEDWWWIAFWDIWICLFNIRFFLLVFQVSPFPSFKNWEKRSFYNKMSKAIDDPIIISVPADYSSEKEIRNAVSNSSNDLCSKLLIFNFIQF